MLILKNKSMDEKKYNSFIKYLHKKCDMISFVIPDLEYAVGVNYEDRIKRLMEVVEPFIVKNYKSDEYCFRKTEGLYNIYNVAFHRDLIEVLCSVRGLYNWIYPYYPEDLCFYKNGMCFLKSIAHEKECWIYTEDDAEIKILEKLGLKFIKMPFEQVPLL